MILVAAGHNSGALSEKFRKKSGQIRVKFELESFVFASLFTKLQKKTKLITVKTANRRQVEIRPKFGHIASPIVNFV